MKNQQYLCPLVQVHPLTQTPCLVSSIYLQIWPMYFIHSNREGLSHPILTKAVPRIYWPPWWWVDILILCHENFLFIDQFYNYRYIVWKFFLCHLQGTVGDPTTGDAFEKLKQILEPFQSMQNHGGIHSLSFS